MRIFRVQNNKNSTIFLLKIVYNNHNCMEQKIMKRRKKYLNNEDVLREIHLSKNSYCSFLDYSNDNQFDIILDDVDKINIDTIQGLLTMRDAMTARRKRLLKADPAFDIASVSPGDLVFRVMTTEHIPLVIKKKSKAKTSSYNTSQILNELMNDDDDEDAISSEPAQLSQEALIKWAKENDVELVPMRTNFPPFYHYRLDNEGKPYLVGKSHWQGDLETGSFCQTHGRLTDKMGAMYIKICERYATGRSWNKYTYVDEMIGQAELQLTQVGLRFNEAITQNPFMYYSQVCERAFLSVLLYEKKMQNIRDDLLEYHGLSPSWTRQLAWELENKQEHNEKDD